MQWELTHKIQDRFSLLSGNAVSIYRKRDGGRVGGREEERKKRKVLEIYLVLVFYKKG